MDTSRIVVRRSSSTLPGLPISTEVHIAFLDVSPSSQPPPLSAQFVTLHVPSVPLSALTSPSFLTANTPTEEPSQKPSTRQKRKRPHPLVVLPAVEQTPSGSSFVVLNRVLYLTLDKRTFHALGIPASRPTSRKADRRQVQIPLPLRDGARAKEALSHPRVEAVDMVLSSGSTPPTPPEGVEGASPAELRGIEPTETRDVVSAGLVRSVASVLEEGNGLDDHFELLDGMDAAQRVLTGIGASPDEEGVEGEGHVTVLRRRYKGVCNGEMWERALQCANDTIGSGAAAIAVLGAVGRWSAKVNEDAPGFGGDSGVVAVIGKDGRKISFELRPQAEV